ncbi:hypothetical protein HK405_012195, partial [Cladochytrium tenue]
RVARMFYGETIRRERFTLFGREVVVPKAANGKALFTFDELCGSRGNPLGPADYLELCRRYHTVVVQSVPILSQTQKNEARRFITLVDAAYEFRASLVISADAAEPEDLFVAPRPDDDDHEGDVAGGGGGSGGGQGREAEEDAADAVMHREMLGDLLGGMVVRPATAAGGGGSGGGVEVARLAVYSGADERFAFRRATSRLREMGTRAYLTAGHRGVGGGGCVGDGGAAETGGAYAPGLDWRGLEGLRGTPGAATEAVATATAAPDTVDEHKERKGEGAELSNQQARILQSDTSSVGTEMAAQLGPHGPRGVTTAAGGVDDGSGATAAATTRVLRARVTRGPPGGVMPAAKVNAQSSLATQSDDLGKAGVGGEEAEAHFVGVATGAATSRASARGGPPAEAVRAFWVNAGVVSGGKGAAADASGAASGAPHATLATKDGVCSEEEEEGVGTADNTANENPTAVGARRR